MPECWVVSIGLYETGSIFIFPHRLITGMSRTCPDLRSPGWMFWDIHFIGTGDLKQSCKFHTDPTWTVAIAWLRFFDGGSADLTWWPDLGPKISQNVCNECSLKVKQFQLPISSRLAMAHEKHEGGLLAHSRKKKHEVGFWSPPPRPIIGLKLRCMYIWTGRTTAEQKLVCIWHTFFSVNKH